jgi:hypothetical protein
VDSTGNIQIVQHSKKPEQLDVDNFPKAAATHLVKRVHPLLDHNIDMNVWASIFFYVILFLG